MSIDDTFKNKVIVKLHLQVADLSVKLAEAEAKADLFKELLEIREKELALAKAKDDKKMKNLPTTKEVK